MDKPAVAIGLGAAGRSELQSLAQAQKTGQARAHQVSVAPTAAIGLNNKAIASTVKKRRRRIATHRLDALLLDEPRPGAPYKIGNDEVADTVRRTLKTTTPGAKHWSLRSIIRAVRYLLSTIHPIWRASRPTAASKRDVTSWSTTRWSPRGPATSWASWSPPKPALVLCLDEKSPIQALDRSQFVLPIRPGQVERRIRDYSKHGTTSLFTALDIASGAVIGPPLSEPLLERFCI